LARRRDRRRPKPSDVDRRFCGRLIKDRYRSEPDAARITLSASARQGEAPVACSVGAGAAIREAQAHLGVGAPGTAACSGNLLLEALAACAQITCQMVATSSPEEIASLREKTERCCTTVLQTLRNPPQVASP
jgi:hypothetical protein